MFRIKDIFRKIKWFLQRGKNGFCDYDTYDIDYWFLKIMPKLLQRYIELNDKGLGAYPDFCSYDEWVDIIDEMIHCFKESNEETCSMKNEYDEEYFDSIWHDKEKGAFNRDTALYEKWRYRQHEIDAYREEMLNKGLDMFKEYFKDLWWQNRQRRRKMIIDTQIRITFNSCLPGDLKAATILRDIFEDKGFIEYNSTKDRIMFGLDTSQYMMFDKLLQEALDTVPKDVAETILDKVKKGIRYKDL